MTKEKMRQVVAQTRCTDPEAAIAIIMAKTVSGNLEKELFNY